LEVIRAPKDRSKTSVAKKAASPVKKAKKPISPQKKEPKKATKVSPKKEGVSKKTTVPKPMMAEKLAAVMMYDFG
jgi:hypothetical protein